MKFKQVDSADIDERIMNLLLYADPSKDMIKNYLPKGICIVGKYRRKPIGVAVLLKVSSAVWELKNIAIAKDYQGKGHGKELLQKTLEEAKGRNAESIEVGTGNSSIDQLAFYQKQGFRISEVIPDFFTDHYEEEIIENGIVCRDMIRLYMDLLSE
ncbi:MAG: GNAT family N-acetyltransferase [Desulfobacterales bacterium]|nr:GNAT family N-acetyltransferase [Desulfobacterales bacterium]